MFPVLLTTSVSSLMKDAATMFSWLLNLCTTLIEYMVSQPIIMIFFLITLAMVGVSVFTRIWQSLRG